MPVKEIEVDDRIATERSVDTSALEIEYTVTVETPEGTRRTFNLSASGYNDAQSRAQQAAAPGEIVLNFQPAGAAQ